MAKKKKKKISKLMSSFYAVAKGRKTGIFKTWGECSEQVKGFGGAIYKKFKTESEANAFIVEKSGQVSGFASKAGTHSELYKLGTKTKMTVAKEEPRKLEKYVDYWPEGDEYEGNESDDEYLTAAMNEIEGVPAKKAKIENSKCPVELEITASKDIKGISFPLNKDGYVVVYTDGSCINNGKQNAVAGYGVFFAEGHRLNAAEPVTTRATNNVGEILASVYAIKTAKDFGISKLCIATDSQFLINSVQKWMQSWKRNNWKTSNGKEVKNYNEFVQLDQLLKDKAVNIKWIHVRGHVGIYGNEQADQLAREGSDKCRRLRECKY